MKLVRTWRRRLDPSLDETVLPMNRAARNEADTKNLPIDARFDFIQPMDERLDS